ncbi:site-specific integrase [Aerococcus sp. UMB8487]|nr:site-specific integrase [Aerococcus sp. UMB8487]
MYKDKKRETWFVKCQYEDVNGERKTKWKRGFTLKKEAKEWERNFLDKMATSPDMTFNGLWSHYQEDIKPTVKATTWENKENIITSKILPFFGNLPLREIKAKHVVKWQNEMRLKGYTPTYLKTLNNQLSAMLNYAVRYYDLPQNPARQAGSMGSKKAPKKPIWTLEDYYEAMSCYDIRYHNQVDSKMYQAIITLIFFTGIRLGEMLALSKNDFDYEEKTVSITKNYQVIDREPVIQTPKTEASIRTISAPQIVFDRLDDYIDTLYAYKPRERLFTSCGKEALNRQLRTTADWCNITPITSHCLRHSHATLLIQHGTSAKVVQHRLGHESIKTTLDTYAHLWDGADNSVANLLETLLK